MKKISVLLLAAVCGSSAAYGTAFLNLDTPLLGYDEGSLEFTLNHRFAGAAFKDDPMRSFLGLANGANVRFGLRYFTVHGLNGTVQYETGLSTYEVIAGWSAALLPPGIEVGASVGYSSIDEGGNIGRHGDFVAAACASAGLFDDRIRPVLNYSYDGVLDEHGPGVGLEVTLSGKFAMQGEYFPLLDDDSEAVDCFSAGGRYTTWGHQFLLGLTNSQGIGSRGQLAGAPDNDLSIALSIHRMF